MDTPNFEGAHNHDRHRTVGPHRAWCHNCREWCYPDGWCACCHESAGHVWLDPSQVSEEAIYQTIFDRLAKTGMGGVTAASHAEIAAAAVLVLLREETR